MEWTVEIARNIQKDIAKLPESVRKRLVALILDIRINGPVRGNWQNYGKLEDNRHHCHLKKGRPTYVVVWETRDNTVKLVRIVYAGTHEKAPY